MLKHKNPQYRDIGDNQTIKHEKKLLILSHLVVESFAQALLI